jgi:hypothetical protein
MKLFITIVATAALVLAAPTKYDISPQPITAVNLETN